MLACSAASCGAAADRPASVDLIETLPTAERRALGSVDTAVRAVPVTVGGETDRALVLRAPARVTWTLRVPADAVLATAIAIVPGEDGATGPGVTLRVAMTDHRYYEGILTLPLRAPEHVGRFTPVLVDLRRYGGWQWSLFYRPWEISWRLIVNADASPGGVIAMRAPVIRRH